jgi:hypothetical protein
VAVSVPVAGTGGQADAHAPEQADMFMPSLAHRYTMRPDPVVKNAPAEPAWVVITVPVVDALAELPAAGAELGDEAAALLQAVASSADANGIPSLTGTGIRASNEWIIFIVSSRATACAAMGRAALGAPQQLLDDVITAVVPQRLGRTRVKWVTKPPAAGAIRRLLSDK